MNVFQKIELDDAPKDPLPSPGMTSTGASWGAPQVLHCARRLGTRTSTVPQAQIQSQSHQSTCQCSMAVVVPAVLEVHLPLRLWASRPEEQGPPDVPRRR